MRIIAIGLGGAGCRIVDSLYAIDRRSSRVACVQGLAVDVDESTLQQLKGLPDSSKLYFPPFDPTDSESPERAAPTATIDIAEIISRIHNLESGENDAIVVCCGLGGQMADIVPHIISGIRSSIVEPIFGLVTLPCLAEGSRRSAKAADDIDILFPLLDGMILFDNETWYKKTRIAAQEKLVKKEKGLAQMLGFGKPEPEISPELATYQLLNEVIVRRISLILKAGEFRADGGIDLAEVVLDSGEVLNTMKGGGFITIGYAVEHLPSNPLAFLSLLKPAGLFNEESKKRASRIVELAKQAIYHEVSTPCDMTSAHKALVLIAGPSHELSMQGFMTVRKWIDRSIRGLEMRSGDYPVMNTKNVAIIIMLSGLENIPRIHEIREIREQGRLGTRVSETPEDSGISPAGFQQETGTLRDEMIVLPKKAPTSNGSSRYTQEEFSPHNQHPTNESVVRASQPELRTPPIPREPIPDRKIEPHPPIQRPVPTREPPIATVRPDVLSEIPLRNKSIGEGQNLTEKRRQVQQPEPHAQNQNIRPQPTGIPDVQSKEKARQRIEQELQRQRMMALSGSPASSGTRVGMPHKPPSAIVKPKRVLITQDSSAPTQPVSSTAPPGEDMLQANAKKTIIVRKRTPAPEQTAELPDTPEPGTDRRLPAITSETPSPKPDTMENSPVPEYDEEPVMLKDPTFRVKDGVFSGRNVRDSAVPKVRDSSLIHTTLKAKNPAEQDYPVRSDREDTIDGERSSDDPRQGKKMKKKDDLSWI